MESTTGNRQSGRTSRMIDSAIDFAIKGKAVYVVAANPHMGREIEKRIADRKDIYGFDPSAIKIEIGIPNHFDWENMRFPGSHPNCVWLFDHYVIEKDLKFMRMYQEATRYNDKSHMKHNNLSSHDVSNEDILSCELEEAIARADKKEKEIPFIVQLSAVDFDQIIMAKEIRRLRARLEEEKNSKNEARMDLCCNVAFDNPRGYASRRGWKDLFS
jgi:hypothetical protein